MELETVTLKTGEPMRIIMLTPPFAPEYAARLWSWPNIREDLHGGKMAQWLYTPYFAGEIGDQTVGSMNYFTPADTRDVGTVGFVQTDEKQRGKGIASALMRHLVEKFQTGGGKALYLATSNPIAGSLYEKHGFDYLVGAEMRCLPPGAEDFPQTYFAFNGKARIRPATWADYPRAAALYNHPEPKWLIKDYLTRTFRDTSYETHYVGLMKRTENKAGVFLALENPLQRTVGMVAVERAATFHEQHVATLSFRVAPAYFAQAAELVKAAVREARGLSFKLIQVYVADCDDDQKRLVEQAGFSEGVRLSQRLRNGRRWCDLLIYVKCLPGKAAPVKPHGDYYGGRHEWHWQRIAARGRGT